MDQTLQALSRVEEKIDGIVEKMSDQAQDIAQLKVHREHDHAMLVAMQRTFEELSKRTEALEQERARVRLLVALIGFIGAAIGSGLVQLIFKALPSVAKP